MRVGINFQLEYWASLNGCPYYQEILKCYSDFTMPGLRQMKLDSNTKAITLVDISSKLNQIFVGVLIFKTEIKGIDNEAYIIKSYIKETYRRNALNTLMYKYLTSEIATLTGITLIRSQIRPDNTPMIEAAKKQGRSLVAYVFEHRLKEPSPALMQTTYKDIDIPKND